VDAHIGTHSHDYVGECNDATTAQVMAGTYTGASSSHLFGVGRVRLQEYTDEQIVALFLTDLENALGEDRFVMNSFSNSDGVYTFNFDITPTPPEGGASSAELFAELQAQSADENSELRQGEVTSNVQSVDTASRTFDATYFYYPPAASHNDENNNEAASSSLTLGLIVAGCIGVLFVVVFAAMLIRKRVVSARAKVCDASFSVHHDLVDKKGASSIPTASADLEAGSLPVASPGLDKVAAAVAVSEFQERDRVWVFTRHA
jgi:hypothetical protein